MGFQEKRNHLLRAAAIGLLAGTVAGCSSGFTRFDESLYTSATDPNAPNSAAVNPYPGDVDATTTASVSNNRYGPSPRPASDVVARPMADHGGYDPAAMQNGSLQSGVVYQQRQPVQRQNLASPNAATAQQSYPAATYPPATDNVTTSSIIPARIPAQTGQTRQAPPANSERGWTGNNGIPITVGEGETVFNLSKRYGVPVDAIMKANRLSDPSQVRVGQRLVIPTYVYGSNVPVSAPDNNPSTRYASSNRGALYAPPAGSVPVPQWAPRRMAMATQPPVQAAQTVPPGVDRMTTGATEAPARKVTWQSSYEVAQGDTLSRIASKHGVRTADLRAANNLSSDNIRIGQRLVIPSGPTSPSDNVRVAQVPQGVDPIITGSTSANDKAAPKPNRETKTAATEAPAQTGIGEFRWPVRGRVIANFGAKNDSGRNDGIDISVPEGTAVKAAENGVVVYAGNELEGFGNLILVRHSGGWVSAYAHNKSLEVNRGDEVRRGEIIARSGRSGNAEMPKLHFELRKNSVPVDPLKHLG